jgi:ubiquitin-like-conjugating enzyme ATG3
VYITYDEYYHTPRLWLSGNDYEGKPLTSARIFEDIIAEYQNETVTEETHPFLGTL